MTPFFKVMAAAGIAVMAMSVTACQSTPTRESTGEYIDSSVITTKVRAKFADDPTVSVFDIGVKTFKDVVQLSGFVNTAAEKEKAGQLAASVEGVSRVENNLLVKQQ